MTGYRVLAEVCVAEDRLDEAGRAIRQAADLNESVGNRSVSAVLMALRAAMCRKRGEFDAARAHLRAAEGVVNDVGRPLLTATHFLDVAELELEAGDPALAGQWLDKAADCVSPLSLAPKAYVPVRLDALRARIAEN